MFDIICSFMLLCAFRSGDKTWEWSEDVSSEKCFNDNDETKLSSLFSLHISHGFLSVTFQRPWGDAITCFSSYNCRESGSSCKHTATQPFVLNMVVSIFFFLVSQFPEKKSTVSFIWWLTKN